MFTVPDNILEELVCDFCYKYLSVGPVKVDNHRRKKCGRCAVDNNQSDVTSVYQFFGENAFFKCINRFDGCEKLLTYGEAINHEKECLGNKYECPLCEKSVEMETYELLYHFKKQHNKNYLINSILRRKLNDFQTVNKFIYLKDNFIFFIFIEYEKHSDNLSLNAFHIGGRNEVYDIKQKYYVDIYGMKPYETNQRNCLSWPNYHDWQWMKDSKKININIPNDCYVVINFEFYVPVKIVNQGIEKNDITFMSLGTGVTASNRLQCEFSAISSKNESSLKPMSTKGTRFIYVDKEDEEKFKKSNWSVSPCRNKLILMTFDGEIEVEVYCKVCLNLGDDDILYITNHGSSRQLICNYCFDVIPLGFTYSGAIISSEDMHVLYRNIKFSCIWNCEIISNYWNIQTHEISCDKNPGKNCPYQNCHFKGSFEKMKMHLSIEHGKVLCFKYFNVLLVPEVLRNHDINISHADTIHHYVLRHDNVLLKCRLIKNSDETVIIEIKSAEKSIHIEDIKFFIWSVTFAEGKYKFNGKYNRNFLNRSERIDLGVLPIKVCIVNHIQHAIV